MNSSTETIASCENCGEEAMQEWVFGSQLCAGCAVLVGMCFSYDCPFDSENPVDICREVYRDIQNQITANKTAGLRWEQLKFERSSYITKKDFDLIKKLRTLPGAYRVEKKELENQLKELNAVIRGNRKEIKQLETSRDEVYQELEAALEKLGEPDGGYEGLKPTSMNGATIEHLDFHILNALVKYQRPMVMRHIVDEVSDRLVIPRDVVDEALNGLRYPKMLVVGQRVAANPGKRCAFGHPDEMAYFLTPAGFQKFREYCGMHRPALDPWQ